MSKWKNNPNVYNGELIDNIISKRTKATLEFVRNLSDGKYNKLYQGQEPIPYDVEEPIIIPFEDGEELCVPRDWKQETIDVYMGKLPAPKTTEPKEENPVVKTKKKGLKGILEYGNRKI